MKESKQVGGCACTAVRFEIERTSWCAHSHNPRERALHAAPMVTYVGVRAQRFRVTAGQDELRSWEPEPGERRRFCGQCGTHLYVESDAWFHQVNVAAAAIDGGPHRKPSGHLWFDNKAQWLEITDELPRFGGPDGSEPLAHGSLRARIDAAHPQVRLAAKWDAPEVTAMYGALAAEAWSSVPPETEANVRAWLNDDTPGGHVLVAEAGQGVVGFCDVKVMPAPAEGARQLFIDDLYVAPQARRQGLGTALLEVTNRLARELGCVHIILHVDNGNTAAAALYERAGFRSANDRVLERDLT